MEDKALERKINEARELVEGSDLSDPHKEALNESIDQAEKSANGSPEKLHDLTVAFCKSVLRSARSDVSFKSRVAEAVQKPLDDLKDEIVAAVKALLENHVLSCPLKGKEPKPVAPTTLLDIAKIAASNKWFYIAVSVIAFSPNLVAVVQLWKK